MGIDIRIRKYILVSIGAILGALFRWQIDEFFLVNIIGCFLLGFFNSLSILKRYRLTLGIGLCGSMTTFNGWSSHLHKLLSQGKYKFFLFNSVSVVLLGMFALALGHILAKKLNA